MARKTRRTRKTRRRVKGTRRIRRIRRIKTYYKGGNRRQNFKGGFDIKETLGRVKQMGISAFEKGKNAVSEASNLASTVSSESENSQQSGTTNPDA